VSGRELAPVSEPVQYSSLLKALLHNRHLQTHAAFTAEYEKIARRIDRGLIGSAPGREQLQRWLSGRVKTLPRPHHCRVLERMFPGHTAAELLAPYRPGAELGEHTVTVLPSAEGVVEQRERTQGKAGKVAGALGDLVAGTLWHGPDALEAALDRGTAGTGRLDFLDAEAERLGARVIKVTPANLLEETLLHLRSVKELLADRQPISAQQQLARIAAKLATVIGEILFVDNHFALARRWYVAARRAALEGGDRELADVALCGETYLPTYSGDPRGVLSFVEPRLDASQSPTPTPAVAWLWAFRAKAHAALADQRGFERSIVEARNVLDKCGPEQIRTGIFSFLPEKLEFYEAHGRVDLGDTGGAIRAAESALRRYDPTDTQEPALVKLEKASALMQIRELEEACQVALAAITEPVTYHGAPVVIRARQFDALLGPTSHANREWREQLAELRLPDPFTLT
jgi:hypothetical protein